MLFPSGLLLCGILFHLKHSLFRIFCCLFGTLSGYLFLLFFKLGCLIDGLTFLVFSSGILLRVLLTNNEFVITFFDFLGFLALLLFELCLTLHVPVVCAHFNAIVCLLRLLQMRLEDHHLDILNWHGIAYELYSELLIVPEVTLEVIEDCTSVTVILCHAFLEHAEHHLSGKLGVFFLVYLRDDLTFLRFLAFLCFL